MKKGKPPVVSIVGRSGSGKTVFLNGLIPALKARGHAVGTIKHHAHELGADRPGSDTNRHFEAGADRVALSGPGQIAYFERAGGERPPAEVVRRFFPGLDLVVTEGFKRGPFPKIEVARRERAETLITELEEGLIAVVADFDPGLPLPRFALDDFDGVAAFLEEKIMARWESPEWTAELTVDGKKIPMKSFVKDFVLGVVMGMVESLKGVPDEPGEVVVKVKRN
ncbi:MAG: molybdopterin-guanine dinucleotide biosynthesis protein B [Planctomycetota bacterium]|jgi:molybdopterin-guanine dinucleotide biosynthesis protein B